LQIIIDYSNTLISGTAFCKLFFTNYCFCKLFFANYY